MNMHFKITLVSLPTKRKYLSSQNLKHPILNCILYTLPLLAGYSSLESLHYYGQFNLFKIIFLYVTQSLHTKEQREGLPREENQNLRLVFTLQWQLQPLYYYMKNFCNLIGLD